MEKATRERLTGAVIFFAVLGVAVPELLSGPGDRAVQEDADAVAEAGPPLTTYDLAIDPAAAGQVARRQALGAGSAARSEAIAQAVPPPVTEQIREAPPPPPAISSSPAPVPVPQAVAAGAQAGGEDKPAARAPVAVERPAGAGAGAGATGRWWVQLGSFESEANAQGLARELRGAGFAIEVREVRAAGKDWHRVLAGPAADRGTAVALRERLAAAGRQGTLVPP